MNELEKIKTVLIKLIELTDKMPTHYSSDEFKALLQELKAEETIVDNTTDVQHNSQI